MSGYRDPSVVGKPCHRPGCGHGHGLHDEEGCTFCECGYFLQHDLMTEVQMVAMWRNRVPHREDSGLYGFLRVFEGYTHEKATALLKGRKPHKPLDSQRVRRDRAMADLGLGPRP